MTSLAGAVQAVDSEELLESLRMHSGPQASVDAALAYGYANTNGIAIHPRVASAKPIAYHGTSVAYEVAKRAVDIVGSLIGLILLTPVVAMVAIMTKLTDGGPIFYPHTRVGKWGREFKCFKFRTMVPNADHIKAEIEHLNTHDDQRTFKVPNDPRVTRVGRWLRRASIDEAPQLWNVLRGEMSLVGPRPPVPHEVELYDLDDMQRLMVKPGLTCIWQVSGRSRLPFPKQLEMDLEYIERRSLLFDMKLMAKTLPAVLTADGAY